MRLGGDLLTIAAKDFLSKGRTAPLVIANYCPTELGHYRLSSMSEDPVEQLNTAIQANHGLAARHLFALPVRVEFHGETVWDGAVEIFEIDHADANRCYAWEYETDDGKRLAATVLGVPPISSALAAVDAHIASGHDPGPTMD